jgi:hypothetical protein
MGCVPSMALSLAFTSSGRHLTLLEVGRKYGLNPEEAA